jgi:hypothetical protein
MKLAKLGILLSAALALSACDDTLKIENGRVPQAFLPYAQELVGEYRGSSEGHPNALQLSLDGDRFVVTSSEDLVMAGCKSVVGNLKSVRYSGDAAKNDVKITSAVLEFSAPNCPSIQGDVLEINSITREEGRISLRTRILSESYPERICRWEGGGPPTYAPREVCETQMRYLYIEGRFSN